MKRFNYYLSLMLLLVFTAACSDEFDQPPMVIPTAAHSPNMTIAEFKAKYWQDVVNYIDTVKEDVVIHGWVTSSDESGNIYKSLYISDGTAGINISINQNSLFNNYRIGQEIVIPLRDYFVGKYNGQQQLGYPAFYEKGGVWEATFLPQAMWESMVELNGLPDLNASAVQPEVVEISDFQGKTDGETLRKYQGKLVRINGVKFEGADGILTFAEASATTNRNVSDESGNTLVVRNSNYADFRADALPEEEVDIVGLLSFYATRDNSAGTWQFYLRDIDDVVGMNSTGTRSNPMSVAEAIEAIDSDRRAWVSGYVVGAVGPEVTTVSSNNDIEWQAKTTMDNTIVLADDPNCKDYTKCVIVPLPQGSQMRADLNMQSNDDVYGLKIQVKGDLVTYMGNAGVVVRHGSTDEYTLPIIRGWRTLKETFDSALPTTWKSVTVSGDKSWFYKTNSGNGYASMSGYLGERPPFEAWFITPPLDIKNAASKVLTFRSEVNGYGSKTTTFEVFIMTSDDPATASKVKLNPVLATVPGSGWSAWTQSGDVDLSQWADGVYYIGFCYKATADDEYATWCIDDVTFGMGTMDNRADFETMGPAKGQIGTYTSEKGWVASNSYLFAGGDSDSNPYFKFIGYMTDSNTDYATAPAINGKVGSEGKIVSPVLKGGMKKLTFSYGAPYSDKLLSFRVDVKQNGNVVQSWTESQDNAVRYQVYSFAKDCNISGDFTIEITNLCPSNSTSNKDRVAIWNLVWEK